MSNKKKKRLVSPTLSNVPVVEPKVVGDPTGNEHVWEHARRYNREQKQQSDAKTAQMIGELNDTVLQLRAAQRDALLKVPSEELAALTTQAPENLAGTVEEIRAQIKGALHSVITKLAAEGATVRDSARDKMVAVTRMNLNVDWRVAANWHKLYDYMLDLGCFTNEDVTLPRKPEPPAQGPTIDALEGLNISGNEGDAKTAKRLATDLMFAQGSVLHHEWLASLYSGFNGFRPSEDDLQYIYRVAFPRLNLSYVDRRSFDIIRRHMCALGR